MKKLSRLSSCLLALGLMFPAQVYSTETVLEKTETKKNEAVDAIKSTYRDAKEKGCEMVNGKMQCLGKKIENKVRSMNERAKTKSKELENKLFN